MGAVAGAGIAGTSLLTGCGSSSSGATEIRFLQNKPEVVGYFKGLVDQFNASQSKVRVFHDSTPTALTPQFVRGAPPDLACYNYNLETSQFVARGALTDLRALPQAATIDPSVQKLVTQFAQFRSQTNVLPYSVTAAGVIYNKTLFEQVGAQIPKTWDQLLAVCKTFKSKGIVPIQQTYKETWTLSQGLFDYVSGSALDVSAFFAELKALGPNAGAGAEVSFTKDFRDAVTKMVTLTAYTNPDAPSRSYPDGNVAFASGKAAMYLQGPWAIGEIVKINPKAQVGTFAMPATDDPADVKCRVNLDLSLWIPVASTKQDAARTFLEYLMRPEVMNKYNQSNLAWGTTKQAPPITDEHIADLRPYLENAKFYQGAGTYVPPSIPLGNYLQQLVIDKDVDGFLSRLDDNWARYAQRSL
jgi:raffinose/stachyose/melibiose transport system substrate-binding protein